MATVVTRSGKGSPLTHSEMDANITNLNTDKAELASPALTGNPTAPTQSAADNSTKVATTAYVEAAITALVDSSPAALNTLNELATAIGNDANFSTTMNNNLATKLAASAVSTFGGTLIDDADAATARTTLGLGTASTSASTAFETNGNSVAMAIALG